MAKVSLQKNYEVRHWMRVFACSELRLREAAKAVGTDEEAVRDYLRSHDDSASKWDALAERSRPGGLTSFGRL